MTGPRAALGTAGGVYVGLMSGTSLDGISAAVVRLHGPVSALAADLLAFVQPTYTASQRSRLEAAMQAATAAEYCRLHADLGDWLADAALAAMAEAGLSPEQVTAVASHGQTLWHEPGHSTWQIGDPARLAERTGCVVVADFRTRDMAAGGQGAPLVPMADQLLFAHPTSPRALQNIGGIGNVTVVPPRNGADASVIAFDTGPGMVVINGVMQGLFGQPFDEDGRVARTGRVLTAVVDAQLRHPYFAMQPPKSTGRELYTPAFIADFIRSCQEAGGTPADCVATATAFTAWSIADQYARFVPTVGETLLSGGGARHPVLVEMLHARLLLRPGAPVVRSFEAVFFNAEAKEAVAFALLAHLHLLGRPGNVPSATGAAGPRLLGTLTPAGASRD